MDQARRQELLAKTALGRHVLASAPAAFGDGQGEDGCRWVTISGAAGTTHVCIGQDGTITKGPAALVGRKHDEALASPPGREAGKEAGKGGPPARQEPRDFRDAHASEAVAAYADGKAEHQLFDGRLGGAGRDTLLEAIMNESGRGGTPRVVSEAEMDGLQKKGWMISYRAQGKESSTTAFKEGELYCGSGIYGNGLYVQAEQGGIWPYLGIGKGREAAIGHVREVYGQHVMKIAIPPDARVANYSDLKHEQAKHRQELCDQRMAGKLTQEQYQKRMDAAADLGRFAAMKNYDAIYCTWDGYYNVLNRSILAVQGKNL